MRAVVLHRPGDVRVEDVREPVLAAPGDAVVHVLASAVCGSDLAVLRGKAPLPHPIRTGHEFLGVVTDAGPEVGLAPGQFVIAPFNTSCARCASCSRGITFACANGQLFGEVNPDGTVLHGGHAERVRVPLAATTLLPVPGAPDETLLPDLLTLADVLPTGHEAALHAGVGPGATVVVVGDGPVGLCAVLASARLGAERIVVMSRDPRRQELAKQFGATDVVAARGDEGVAEVVELLGGGSRHVVEAVGTAESIQQAIGCAAPGCRLGCVGLPWGVQLPLWDLFGKGLTFSCGPANVRATAPGLLADVLDRKLRPGAIFDVEYRLTDAPQAFHDMHARRCVKPLLRP